jgi:hypothetical protein
MRDKNAAISADIWPGGRTLVTNFIGHAVARQWHNRLKRWINSRGSGLVCLAIPRDMQISLATWNTGISIGLVRRNRAPRTFASWRRWTQRVVCHDHRAVIAMFRAIWPITRATPTPSFFQRPFSRLAWGSAQALPRLRPSACVCRISFRRARFASVCAGRD